MNLKHEELIRECIAHEGITASEKVLHLFDRLLTIADSFEELGRKHRAEEAPALSVGELRLSSARSLGSPREIEAAFSDLIETCYMNGYEEGGEWKD